MNYNKLENLSFSELKVLSEKLGIKPKRSKEEIYQDVSKAFKEYEHYKKTHIDKYKKIKQLGKKGKEGTTFLVTDGKKEYAMKTFKSQKSSAKLKQEGTLQQKASKKGISPQVFAIDTVSNYILMEKMDQHLIDLLEKQKGVLKKNQQKEIINIYRNLDEAGVFHGDANILNYMIYNKKIYIIDFGMAKPITNELIHKLGTSTPNIHIMTLGLILKLKELNCPAESYSFLKKFMSPEQIVKFNL